MNNEIANDRWNGKLYLEDGWIEPELPSIDIIEPATGEVLGQSAIATVAELSRAAQRAKEAQREWVATAPTERAAVLRRAGDFFLKNREELGLWVQKETGGVPTKAAIEVSTAANECFDAAALPNHPSGEVLASDADHWSFARRFPVGVVAVISPFNFPLILSIRSVAPALALGNSVILKPDPRTPVSGGYMIMRALEQAGLPAGVLQLLPGGADVGAAMTEDPLIDAVSFTGSTAAGRKVGEACGKNLKRVHLELGGNNALVVLPGADLDKAASAGAFGSFLHQGQICMSTGRHLVHESIYDAYVAALAQKAKNLPVGDPAAEQVAIGPIIDEGQRDAIHGIVESAKERGDTIEAGGEYSDLFYRPTVISVADSHSPAWTDEIFGPVAPVISFSTDEEAIELINESDYGLSVSILGDVGHAMKIADQIKTGKLHINEQTVGDESNAPFGGVGDSGNGSRFGGYTANIEAYTEIQWLTVRSEIAPYPF